MAGNHIYSEWTVGNGIRATVFLESAFPKIVFDEAFVREHIDALQIELIEPEEDTFIRMWTAPAPTRVSYLIKDSVQFNGRRIFVDGFVADRRTSHGI